MSVGSEMIFTRLESGRAGMDEDRKDLDDQELLYFMNIQGSLIRLKGANRGMLPSF